MQDITPKDTDQHIQKKIPDSSSNTGPKIYLKHKKEQLFTLHSILNLLQHATEQCCGSEISHFGSGSYFPVNYGFESDFFTSFRIQILFGSFSDQTYFLT